MASTSEELLNKINNDIPIDINITLQQLNQRLESKEHLLNSIDCSKLPDNGEKIRNDIEQLKNMIDRLDKGDSKIIRAISLSQIKEKHINHKKNIIKQSLNKDKEIEIIQSNNNNKDNETINNNDNDNNEDDEELELLQNLTKRFSKLNVDDNIVKPPSKESEEKYQELLMGSKEYNIKGGINRPQVQTLSLEETSQLEKVNRIPHLAKFTIPKTIKQ